MGTTTTPDTGELRLVLDDIHRRRQRPRHDQEHVENLAQSIGLRGVLVAVIVRPMKGGYELVAGFHRLPPPAASSTSPTRRSSSATRRARAPQRSRRIGTRSAR